MTLDQQNDSSKFLLNSVNIMLQLINQLPVVDDVELAEILEAQLAASVLIETKKDVLAEGWDFNSDTAYKLPTDEEGYINLPSNILEISSQDGDIISRDNRLYSKKNQTAIFEDSVEVDIKWDVDFNTISHTLRNYITIKAARRFHERTIGDAAVAKYTMDDEQTAYLSARRSEGFTGRYNMLTSPYGATARIF